MEEQVRLARVNPTACLERANRKTTSSKVASSRHRSPRNMQDILNHQLLWCHESRPCMDTPVLCHLRQIQENCSTAHEFMVCRAYILWVFFTQNLNYVHLENSCMYALRPFLRGVRVVRTQVPQGALRPRTVGFAKMLVSRDRYFVSKDAAVCVMSR